MTTTPASNRLYGLSTARLEALSDGVLAIVITLLSLDFLNEDDRISKLKHASNWEVFSELIALWPHLAGYVLSFLLIGVYWITHHVMFHQIHRTNRTLMWLNIAFLMSVSFLPFPTDLIAECATHESNTVVAFYGISHLITSLSLLGLWTYAMHYGDLVHDDVEPECQRRLMLVSTVAPILYVVGIALSFISVPAAFVTYAVVPILYIAPGFIDYFWLGQRSVQAIFPTASFADRASPTA